jgi:hypothetical protein
MVNDGWNGPLYMDQNQLQHVASRQILLQTFILQNLSESWTWYLKYAPPRDKVIRKTRQNASHSRFPAPPTLILYLKCSSSPQLHLRIQVSNLNQFRVGTIKPPRAAVLGRQPPIRS